MARNGKLCIGFSLTATWLRGKNKGTENKKPQESKSHVFYAKLARRAEDVKLDFVFKPDALYLNPSAAGGSPSFAGLEPTIMLAAIASETERIGLVTTASTTFNPPYVVARQLQSLHWVSNGRAGWNIVTSIEGAANFGNAPMPSAEERYRKAAEFTEVVRRLWESYPYEALSSEGECGQDTEKDRVRPIDHTGDYFSVKGPLNVPAHEAGRIPLFQAGASDRGRDFAATVADAIFAATPDMVAGVELRSDLRKRAQQNGRPADAIKVLPGLYFFLAESREEARRLHRDAHAHLSAERRHAALKSVLGLDLSDLPPGRRVTPDLLPDPEHPVRSRTHADLLRRYIARETPTVEELLSRPEVVGSAHWVSVGTVDDVLNDITEWFEAGAMDGFIALPGGSESSLDLFFEALMPALVEKGLFRREYKGATLLEHLGIQ